MSDTVRNIVAEILVALLTNNRDDLLLLVNEADLHTIAANEPTFFQAERNLAGGEDRYFLGVRLQVMGNKGSPKVVRRIC